jgi:hypothetical protein
MAHDVFISHSAADKPLADTVCAGLETRGLRCWIAPRDIPPGADRDVAVIDAITGARVMVLIFSASANRSRQIKREVERAVARGMSIVPLRTEDVPPGKTLEPLIRARHWMDALSRPLDPHVERLADAVRALLARPSRDRAFGIPKPAAVTGTAGNLATVSPFRPRPAPEPAPVRSLEPARARGMSIARIALLAAALAALAYMAVSMGRGGPPNILSVQFPTTIYAGQQATGTIAFEDAKKSVASARFDVVEATSFPGFTVGTPEAAGRTSGTISFRVNSPTPQHVVLQAVLVDAAGRQSKPVPFAFDIRTPPAGSSKGRRSPREWSIQMPHGARSQLPR